MAGVDASASLARARVLEARDKLSDVFSTLDGVAPLLDEPERGAALELRGKAADLLRRMGGLATFLGGAS